MIENIDDLEKQVKVFQENILASSELLREISSLVEAVKAQQQSNQSNSDGLRTSIEEYTKKIQEKTDQLHKSLSGDIHACLQNVERTSVQTMEKIKENVEGTIKSAVDRLIEAQRDYIMKISDMDATLQNSCTSMEKKLAGSSEEFNNATRQTIESIHANTRTVLSDAVNVLNKTQREYIEQVKMLEASVKSSVEMLEGKYSEFLTRLEATNIDQLFHLCQDIRKSINLKLAFALVGVGVAIAFSALTFFLK